MLLQLLKLTDFEKCKRLDKLMRRAETLLLLCLIKQFGQLLLEEKLSDPFQCGLAR